VDAKVGWDLNVLDISHVEKDCKELLEGHCMLT
jgi:hypothetical protein